MALKKSTKKNTVRTIRESSSKRTKLQPNRYKVDHLGCINFLGSSYYIKNTLEGETVHIYVNGNYIYATSDGVEKYPLVKREETQNAGLQ